MVRFLDWVARPFTVDMGIDLGTANTLVCLKDRGIVLNEPSIVAVRKGTNEVLLDGMAVGNAAIEYLGRTPPHFSAIRPMKSGVIADFEITERMLRYFIRKVQGGRRFVKPQVVIAVPWGITMVEKRAVIGSAERAGARRVFLVDEPTAAGIGARLPVHKPQGCMVVDVGGGTSEVAVLSLANVVEAECLRREASPRFRGAKGDNERPDSFTSSLRRTVNVCRCLPKSVNPLDACRDERDGRDGETHRRRPLHR